MNNMDDVTNGAQTAITTENDGTTVVTAAAAAAVGEEQPTAQELEKIEEEKLKSKYPMGFRGPGGHTVFLQKRLQKGQKYFDSGDYQMAKQKGGGVKQVFANKVSTGEAIPTPETVPVRKTSIIQSCNKFPAMS